MKKFKNCTLKEYLDVLARKEPVPGGGSALALAGALGAGLLSMVTQYSIGRKHSSAVERRLKKNLKQSETIRQRLTELVDLDAQAYWKVVKARRGSAQDKKKAAKAAAAVPREIGRLCFQAVQLAPFLVQNGNKYLIGDVIAAVEILSGAFHSSRAFTGE